jgi:hypothetical protein
LFKNLFHNVHNYFHNFNLDEVVLKFSWTSIYSGRLQVHTTGVYLLTIPGQGVAYDAEKERVASKEAKERQLAPEIRRWDT